MLCCVVFTVLYCTVLYCTVGRYVLAHSNSSQNLDRFEIGGWTAYVIFFDNFIAREGSKLDFVCVARPDLLEKR